MELHWRFRLIAAYIALQGNPVGLVVPLLACAAVMWLRYKFTYIGYNSGRKLATGFADAIAPITEAASILCWRTVLV